VGGQVLHAVLHVFVGHVRTIGGKRRFAPSLRRRRLNDGGGAAAMWRRIAGGRLAGRGDSSVDLRRLRTLLVAKAAEAVAVANVLRWIFDF
jgi:hypothetical protein